VAVVLGEGGDAAIVVHAACGGGHSCLVTKDGGVWTVGSGSCGQLGHGAKDDLQQWTRIQGMASENVRFAACGEEFTVRENAAGPFVLDHSHFLTFTALRLACALSTQVLVDVRHSVYSFGLGNVGQLGHGECTNESIPTLVKAMSGKGTELLACSQGQTLAVTASGVIYAWGLAGNDADQYRNQAQLDARRPSSDTLIQALPAAVGFLSRKRIFRLECGRKHYAIVSVQPVAINCVVKGLVRMYGKGRSRSRRRKQIRGKAGTVIAGRKKRFRVVAVDQGGEQCTAGGDKFTGVAMLRGSALPNAFEEAAITTPRFNGSEHDGNIPGGVAGDASNSRMLQRRSADVEMDDNMDGSYDGTACTHSCACTRTRSRPWFRSLTRSPLLPLYARLHRRRVLCW
jgi:alpha-tubulin suppressor-like RCC1 family protein